MVQRKSRLELETGCKYRMSEEKRKETDEYMADVDTLSGLKERFGAKEDDR